MKLISVAGNKCRFLIHKDALCTCDVLNEQHCLWPAEFAFPDTEDRRAWTSHFFRVESSVHASAVVGLQELHSLCKPRAWVDSAVINAFITMFNDTTEEPVYFVDCTVMLDWISKTEELYNVKFRAFEGTETSMFVNAIIAQFTIIPISRFR